MVGCRDVLLVLTLSSTHVLSLIIVRSLWKVISFTAGIWDMPIAQVLQKLAVELAIGSSDSTQAMLHLVCLHCLELRWPPANW